MRLSPTYSVIALRPDRTVMRLGEGLTLDEARTVCRYFQDRPGFASVFAEVERANVPPTVRMAYGPQARWLWNAS